MALKERPLVLREPWLPGGLSAIWLSVIFLVSAWPAPTIPEVGPPGFWTLLGHLSIYAILAPLLSWLGLSLRRYGRHDYFILAIAFVLATMYGAAMEAYQATVPTRHPSWFDGVTNALGAAFGLAAVHVLRFRLRL